MSVGNDDKKKSNFEIALFSFRDSGKLSMLFIFLSFHNKNLSNETDCPYNSYSFPSQIKIENHRQDCCKDSGNCYADDN